jgi:hypothetical protein
MSAGPYGWPMGPPPSRTATRVKVWSSIVGAIVLALAARSGILYLHSRPHRGPIPGYEERLGVLRHEYQAFYGKLASDPGVERLFEDAAREVSARRNPAAVELLRSAAKDAALPVIFNDLGVLLAANEDRAQAGVAFQEALGRDPENALAQGNVARLGFDVEMTRPVTQEAEPNNSSVNANLVPLGKDVSAEISEGGGDIDCFRFFIPTAPRDHISIEVESRSATLELGMRMFDGEGRLALDRPPAAPGAHIVEYIAPRPNTSWALEFWSAHGTSGDYVLRVSPMRAFDRYEPNDNIFAASPIEVDTPIQANIMDVEDTDFYSFESPAGGTVTIELENRSSTLIPALTTFGPDKRNTGFGPDIRTAGQSLRHTMAVEAHQTYYLQVWAQARSSGAYSLTIR